MEVGYIIKLVREALLTTLIISAPALGAGLLIGLIVSIFQATTQIQEQTLTFVPKFIGIFLAIVLTISFIAQILINFTRNLILSFPDVIK